MAFRAEHTIETKYDLCRTHISCRTYLRCRWYVPNIYHLVPNSHCVPKIYWGRTWLCRTYGSPCRTSFGAEHLSEPKLYVPNIHHPYFHGVNTLDENGNVLFSQIRLYSKQYPFIFQGPYTFAIRIFQSKELKFSHVTSYVSSLL